MHCFFSNLSKQIVLGNKQILYLLNLLCNFKVVNICFIIFKLFLILVIKGISHSKEVKSYEVFQNKAQSKIHDLFDFKANGQIKS